METRRKTVHFASLISPSKIILFEKQYRSIRHNVSSPDETPRSSLKILRCEPYFQLASQRFIWWWNTASHAWYITSQSDIVQIGWPLHKSRPNIYTQFMCFQPRFYKTSGKTEICKTFLCETVKFISDYENDKFAVALFCSVWVWLYYSHPVKNGPAVYQLSSTRI